ncbi:NACHT domain-containing NTPase [Larkinella sp. C7]|jgi:energy-coupling factor transporter ATP-binding protein EcfA2|uniref:NACHT domain-containing protein n=1 Tax=Larkinella sp. C7 TaxID=2576607 RepID=UPI00111100D8|nr:hypothetical protein [Larkinella sp. C7]
MINPDKIANILKGIEFPKIIAEFLITKIGESIISHFKENFSKAKNTLQLDGSLYLNELEYTISREIIIERIAHNIVKSNNWSNEINLSILYESKELKEIFIELEIYLSQVRENIEPDDETKKIKSNNLINKLDKHILLYGAPGAGKTTLMMNIFGNLLKNKYQNIDSLTPIVIRFRELTYDKNEANTGLFEILLETFGLSLSNLKSLINKDEISKETYNLVPLESDEQYAKLLRKEKEKLEKKRLEKKEENWKRFPNKEKIDQISEEIRSIETEINRLESIIKPIRDNREHLKNNITNQLYKSIKNFRREAEMALVKFIDDCNLAIILEGFDEIPDINIKNQIEKDLGEFSLSLNYSKFIITSRNGEFNSKLNNCRTFEICPLSETQIISLSKKWLVDEKISTEFIEKIKAAPFSDTAIRPLTLAYLCAIYEKRKDIPSKPRYVYNLVVDLLIEKWDYQRLITRVSRITNYSMLDLYRVREFLAHLSFILTYKFKKINFDTDDLIEGYEDICYNYGLPRDQAPDVAKEIESHNGIFIKIGYNSYKFAHKSLQEYLTAKYIKDLPGYPHLEIISKLPNEMAIVVCMSSNPNEYLNHLLQYLHSLQFSYWLAFIFRLQLEKPDFTEDKMGILFFISIIKYFKKGKDRNMVDKLSQAIINIFKFTNINICFNDIFKNYNMDVFNSLTNEVRFSAHIDSNTSNPNIPSQFYLNAEYLLNTPYYIRIEKLPVVSYSD